MDPAHSSEDWPNSACHSFRVAYPLVVKRGNWKSPIGRGFRGSSGRIIHQQLPPLITRWIRMVYNSSWVSSFNSITSLVCYFLFYWCSCLKTLSLAPSLPLQALLLLLELAHLCPLGAEFWVAVAKCGKSYPAGVSSNVIQHRFSVSL